ncbi:hypothetical protein HHK36_028356 [Tetracentron sinense]|uniref:Pentatricopeptide repeat-containing protein n=1 Tax=Tetracentron sinense TaxID=13715 RepID=A0A834YF93_TETSI|nr:hypothetical protein HHK36_028356 [Tetracentron sinense]
MRGIETLSGSWNGLMRRHVARGAHHEALQMLSWMHRKCKQVMDMFSFPVALKACTALRASRQGQQIHALVLLLGFQSHLHTCNALLTMYSSCGHLQSATRTFDAMSHRSTVSWNSIMAACILNGFPHASLSYFSRMLFLLEEEDHHPDSITICTLLHALSHIGPAALLSGRAVHCYILRSQIATTTTALPFVENALIQMYLDSSCLAFAEKVFLGMPTKKRDLVTWTTVISGYMHYRLDNLALATFRSMLLQEGEGHLDPVALATVTPALGSLLQGKEMHCFAIKNGSCNVFVATSLLHMYAEFGAIESAVKMFERVEKRNVVAWTAMITAYAKHGLSEDSLRLFDEMREQEQEQEGVIPNHLTFMGVLTACAHSGLVEQARNCFKCMTEEYGLTPDMYHYAGMVDVLGRAGQLNEALKFIEAMPVEPNAHVWGSLLAACDLHQDVELGRQVAKVVSRMEPDNPGNFVLLSNMLAQDLRWEDATFVRETMIRRSLKKEPGQSQLHLAAGS